MKNVVSSKQITLRVTRDDIRPNQCTSFVPTFNQPCMISILGSIRNRIPPRHHNLLRQPRGTLRSCAVCIGGTLQGHMEPKGGEMRVPQAGGEISHTDSRI